MKTKIRKNIRQPFSLLLCCLLIIGCLGLSAAADSSPAPTPEASAGPADTDAGDTGDEGGAGDTPDLPPDGGEDQPDADPSPEPPPEGSVAVTFDFGEYGSVTQYVLPGQCPESVPDVPGEFAWQGYVAAEWLDGDGAPVDPCATAVDSDAVYTARLERSVDALLNTDEHKSYINGVSGEIFNPQGHLTRAEAATLFSNLLRTKDFEHTASFSDVKASSWYSDAVGLVNALGIATGSGDKFRPSANITRAEFVKMAAACDSLEEADCPFTDVPDKSWARPYIASAYAKGWVKGTGNGKFNPGGSITRAEAVVILNNMLGREPDPGIEDMDGLRWFCDVFPTHWAYGDIMEASTSHEFTAGEEDGELWTEHIIYEPTEKRGWLSAGGNRYYIGPDGKALRGQQTIGGVKYLFDSTGAGMTGFVTEGSWKRYYKNGLKVEDISGLGVVSGPYYIKVYKPANYLIIFAKDGSGTYNIPVRSMLVSCGNPTPTGDYYTPARYRWLEMVGGSWAQWCTQITGSYLFHSVPNDLKNNYTMWSGEYNNLGTTRSLGCIRLNCEDAKWIYDNCALGTHVYVSPTETSGPLSKPAGLKIPSWHTWDPTDPTAKYLCQERGCH